MEISSILLSEKKQKPHVNLTKEKKEIRLTILNCVLTETEQLNYFSQQLLQHLFSSFLSPHSWQVDFPSLMRCLRSCGTLSLSICPLPHSHQSFVLFPLISKYSLPTPIPEPVLLLSFPDSSSICHSVMNPLLPSTFS